MKLKCLDYTAIIISLLVFAGFLFYGASVSADSGMLLVREDSGKALYPLSEDRHIIANGPVGESVIVIKDGCAGFEHSDCKNKLCVLMGTISKGGEWAACLPNKVFISIEGEKDDADTLSY